MRRGRRKDPEDGEDSISSIDEVTVKETGKDDISSEISENGEDESTNEVPRSLLAYPVPNPLVEVEVDKDGIVTLIYRKNLGKFESWLQKKIGGPLDIRRPLDAPGSRIWSLSDGDHNIMEITQIIDREFKEEMSPAFQKVRRFYEQLLILNLIILKSAEEIAKEREEGQEVDSEDQEDAGSEGDKVENNDEKSPIKGREPGVGENNGTSE